MAGESAGGRFRRSARSSYIPGRPADRGQTARARGGRRRLTCVRDHVDVDEVVELTAALVAVDTRNPPGNERPIEEVVRAALDRWRPTWTEVEPAPGRMSLVAALPHPDRPGRPAAP